MKIRNYTATDKSTCIDIFKSNQPKFFAEHELVDFIDFLDEDPQPYYCLVDSETVVGCGGYWVDLDNKQASLTWGMIKNNRHGEGLGKRLTVYRLHTICISKQADTIRIDTSQHTFEFYKKLGFIVDKITPDGYTKGLHQYDMTLPITPATSQKIREQFNLLELQSP